ncbi:MAG: hypothetical protein JNL74_02845 [Fibrobacteres bacterium]|nr:hypothetical protein [Fibrobacterota bacterium]
MQSRKGSDFRLSRYIVLLGLFGLLHSVNEWMDMFLLLGLDYWGQQAYKVIGIVRFFIGKISYVFLFLFGLSLLKSLYPKVKAIYYAILFAHIFMMTGLFVYGIARNFDAIWFLRTDYTARYFAAFPGAILSGIGIWLYKDADEIQDFKKDLLPIWFKSCAVLFWCYAILAGLIVKEGTFFPADIINTTTFKDMTGLPVQVFRAACAIGLSIFIVRILRLFEYERSRKLEKAYSEIVRISTDEQERIGRDIHDDLCQEITGIQLMAKAAENGLDPSMVAQKTAMTKIGEIAKIATNKARGMAKNLYPVEITERGLIHALTEYCFRVSEIHKVECTFLLSGTTDNIDHMISTHLFRIAQEAVNNAIRHGQATQVKVNLNLNNVILLSIEDNGTAADRHVSANEGMGMKIMKYRASIAGGIITTNHAADGGTIIEVKI